MLQLAITMKHSRTTAPTTRLVDQFHQISINNGKGLSYLEGFCSRETCRHSLPKRGFKAVRFGLVVLGLCNDCSEAANLVALRFNDNRLRAAKIDEVLAARDKSLVKDQGQARAWLLAQERGIPLAEAQRIIRAEACRTVITAVEATPEPIAVLPSANKTTNTVVCEATTPPRLATVTDLATARTQLANKATTETAALPPKATVLTEAEERNRSSAARIAFLISDGCLPSHPSHATTLIAQQAITPDEELEVEREIRGKKGHGLA